MGRMINEFEKNKDTALIVSPIYKGKKGHPLLFSHELFSEILNMDEHGLIRDIVHKHINSLLTLEANKWTIKDIDTPEDLATAVELVTKNKA